VALRAKKAALEQEYEMLKYENDFLTRSLKESDPEALKEAEDEMLTPLQAGPRTNATCHHGQCHNDD
jgi:hypothetical protein